VVFAFAVKLTISAVTTEPPFTTIVLANAAGRF
jgi:hypothetical protein